MLLQVTYSRKDLAMPIPQETYRVSFYFFGHNLLLIPFLLIFTKTETHKFLGLAFCSKEQALNQLLLKTYTLTIMLKERQL